MFQRFLFNLCQIKPNQTTYLLLASLVNFNKGGAWLPQDSESLDLNAFNRLLSLLIMGLLGPKYILLYSQTASIYQLHAHSRAVVFHTLDRGQRYTILFPLIS